MRLTLILPPVQPAVYPQISGCPSAGCGGRHVQHWQAVPTPLRDTVLSDVVAQRSRCVRCGRTFRVEPKVGGHDQTSVRCAEPWLTVGIRVDAVTGTALSLDLLPTGEATTLSALATIHRRSLGATKPPKGGTMSLAYRRRVFSLDRWHLWPRLTRDRTWAGPDGETLDGTNNACARARGARWAGWVKERDRSMCGSKQETSVLHVSRLIAAMGQTLDGPGFALAEVIA